MVFVERNRTRLPLLFVWQSSPNDLSNIGNPLVLQKCFDPLDNLHTCARIHKVGAADLYSRGSGHEKFERVVSVGDPTTTDQWNQRVGLAHCACNVVDHMESQGFNGWPAEAAGQGRAPILNIDAQAR